MAVNQADNKEFELVGMMLRIPRNLHDRLREAAFQSGASMNKYVIDNFDKLLRGKRKYSK